MSAASVDDSKRVCKKCHRAKDYDEFGVKSRQLNARGMKMYHHSSCKGCCGEERRCRRTDGSSGSSVTTHTA